MHSKFEGEFNEKVTECDKICLTLCFQLFTPGIKRIGFIRYTNKCQKIMSILRIYTINLTPLLCK